MRKILCFLCIFSLALTIIFPAASSLSAATDEVDRLRDEITARNDRLAEITREIAQYEAELQKVGSEKKTLQAAINQLELERKKITANINYTQNKIGSTDLEISKLSFEIDETETDIGKNKSAIQEILRRIDTTDRNSLIESLLQYKNLSEFWGQISALEEIRTAMGDEVRDLVELKGVLEDQRGGQQKNRDSLVDLKNQYSDQQKVLDNNKTAKNSLLKETQGKEAAYQALLTQKQEARAQIEKELRDFESQLQFILDPTTIPTPGTAVFNLPLKSFVVTQYFGGTEFAKRNPGIYAGRAYHPGIDMGTPRGTQIFAPLSGTVRATGNTDAFPGCYSWGKWTLIDHANGLSTLYAHQDTISVSPGDTVKTGDVIGYTGNTGYSTGPHLHFAVYAKDGVSIKTFKEIKTVTSCGSATTPVAATDAYLDPTLYLPAI